MLPAELECHNTRNVFRVTNLSFTNWYDSLQQKQKKQNTLLIQTFGKTGRASLNSSIGPPTLTLILEGRRTGKVNKRPKHRISNTPTPNVIYLTNISQRLRGTVTAPQTSVGPSPGWASQIRQLLNKRTKTRVPNPCRTSREENSVSRHAQLSPVDASQPPVDNHITKREKGGYSVSILPHCSRSGDDRLRRSAHYNINKNNSNIIYFFPPGATAPFESCILQSSIGL